MSSAVLSTLWRAMRLWLEQLPYHRVIHPVRMLSVVQQYNLGFSLNIFIFHKRVWLQGEDLKIISVFQESGDLITEELEVSGTREEERRGIHIPVVHLCTTVWRKSRYKFSPLSGSDVKLQIFELHDEVGGNDGLISEQYSHKGCPVSLAM